MARIVMEYRWNIEEICMEHAWSICGIMMEYAWNIDNIWMEYGRNIGGMQLSGWIGMDMRAYVRMDKDGYG